MTLNGNSQHFPSIQLCAVGSSHGSASDVAAALSSQGTHTYNTHRKSVRRNVLIFIRHMNWMSAPRLFPFLWLVSIGYCVICMFQLQPLFCSYVCCGKKCRSCRSDLQRAEHISMTIFVGLRKTNKIFWFRYTPHSSAVTTVTFLCAEISN